jgi:hypothetical protein
MYEVVDVVFYGGRNIFGLKTRELEKYENCFRGCSVYFLSCYAEFHAKYQISWLHQI